MPLKTTTFALTAALLLITTLGCESKKTETAKPAAATPESKPAATDQQAETKPVVPAPEAASDAKPEEDIVKMLRGEQPKATPTEQSPMASQLPAGHPPIGDTGGSPHSGMGMGMGMSEPQAGANPLTFTAPDSWVAEKPKNMMRKAQYKLPGEGDGQDGEVVVFYFGPGQGGDNESNIQRWVGQFSKADGSPLGADDVTRTKETAGDLPVTMVEFAGTFNAPTMGGMSAGGTHDNYRMLAGIVEVGDDRWFIKATGPDATIKAHQAEIQDYIKSAMPDK